MNTEENKGIDAWNDRLDQNLESEQSGDKLADKKAAAYSAAEGSGDQSDAAKPEGDKQHPTDYEDNMEQSQPTEQDPTKPLSREE